jgi:hypothetical protein
MLDGVASHMSQRKINSNISVALIPVEEPRTKEAIRARKITCPEVHPVEHLGQQKTKIKILLIRVCPSGHHTLTMAI